MQINLREYQRQVVEGMFIKPGIDPVVHAALGLTGEAGEVADLVKKSQYVGRELDEFKLIEEMGDTLWYLTYLSGAHGLTLDALAFSNIKKLQARHGVEHYSTTLLKLVPV